MKTETIESLLKAQKIINNIEPTATLSIQAAVMQCIFNTLVELHEDIEELKNFNRKGR